MSLRQSKLALLAFLTAPLCSPLTAQKLPLANGQLLQVHDLRALDRPDAPRKDLENFTNFARFARRFAEPALDGDNDIRLLGSHQLAVLGTPEHCAWVEQLVTRCAQLREAQIDIECALIEVSTARFDEHLKGFFDEAQQGKKRWRTTDRDTIAKVKADLAGAGTPILSAPRLLVLHMQRATMSVGETIRYTSDFEVEIVDGKPVTRAISHHLFDGIEIDLQAGSLEDDFISIDCTIRHSRVMQPLPEAIVEVSPGHKEIVHLPRSRQVEFTQQVVVPKDSAAAVAVQRADGNWLLAVVMATQFQ